MACAPAICSIENCYLPVRCRKMCSTHYQRWRKHGDPHQVTLREDRTKHGHAKKGSLSPEYHTWASMVNRCTNPNNTDYKDYGGRGIQVCSRWHRFENFLADMGRRPSQTHSIDRVNHNGDYAPSNCRWATPTEQGNNKRNNQVVEFQGKRQTIAQWARELGVRYATLRDRLNRYKWPIEKALTTL